MKRLQSTTLLIVLAFTFACAQDNEQNSHKNWKYLGMEIPGQIPEVFAPGVISTEAYEFGATFSPDGKELFFTRRPDYEGSENRIFYIKYVNDQWSEVSLAPFSENSFEFEPQMTPDGNTVYFYSERSGERDKKYDGDLWFSTKEGNHWNEPVYFSSLVNKKWCMSVSSALNGNIYFTGNHDGKRGIFRAKPVSDEYNTVEYLSDSINMSYYSHPYIAPDESFLLMDGQPEGRGKSEIFISFRKSDESWTKPTNLGKSINSTKTEFAAIISPDGKYLFFHRRVEGNGDIYWVDAKVIEALKPTDQILGL